MMMMFPQYEVKAPMPSACFRNVCKQKAKMHEAISELLPEEQTQVRIRTASARCGESCPSDVYNASSADALSTDQRQFQDAPEAAAGSTRGR